MSNLNHNGGPPLDDESYPGREGFVAIVRTVRDHWLVGFGQTVPAADPDRGVYSRAEAWIDLIMECKYKPGSVDNNGRRMDLKPGQMLGAVAWLAYRWNWTSKTVRGFLDRLESEGMIEAQNPGTMTGSDEELNGHVQGKSAGRLARVLTLCNYEIYQVANHSQGQVAGTAEGRSRASSGQVEGNNLTKKQITTTVELGDRSPPIDRSHLEHASSDCEKSDNVQKNLASEAGQVAAKPRKRIAYPERFETFWRAYPETNGMSKAEALKAWHKLDEPDQDLALAAIPALKALLVERRKDSPSLTCLHATTYLNQRRFETLAAKPAGHWWRDSAKVAAMTVERWKAGIAQYANGIWPVDKLGPPPGHRECVVPAALIAEMRLTERYDHRGISREKHQH